MDKTDNFHTPPRPQLNKDGGLSIPPTPFLNFLGAGTGVNVWSLNKPGISSPWAIKNVRKAMEKNTRDKYQNLINKEADVLANIQHENIVGFRAFLKSDDGRNCLAMESCGTSLGNMIEDREENGLGPFQPKNIFQVVYNISKALHYLHTDKRLLHGDVKSYNILIKNNFKTIKLCDLGVCVRMDENGIMCKNEEYTGTLVYNAPEVIDPELYPNKISGKSEIFSLGLVIYEMLALCPPHCNGLEDSMEDSFTDTELSLDSSQVSLFPKDTLGTRPPLPENLGNEYQDTIEIYHLCTEHEPEDRPDAQALIDYISAENILS